MQNNKKISKRWSSRSLAPEFFHRIFYGAIRLAGRPAAYFMLVFVVGFYCLIPRIRKRAKPYIEKRFGCTSRLKNFLHTYRLYWNFGTMLVDRSTFLLLGNFKAEGSDRDKEKLRSLYKEHGRIILLTAHAGCWQMGISFLDFIDAPKAVVMLMESGNVERDAFKVDNCDSNKKENNKITIISPDLPMGGTLEMLSALNHGSVLCINADRTFGSEKHIVKTDFLGGKIKLPISAYKLAASTGAPIAVVFSARTGPGEGRFWVADVMHVSRDADKGAIRSPEAFAPYARTFAYRLEEFCREYPWQFYNFFNMWY